MSVGDGNVVHGFVASRLAGVCTDMPLWRYRMSSQVSQRPGAAVRLRTARDTLA